MVALVCRNNKSTRYAAPLQSLKHQFQLYLTAPPNFKDAESLLVEAIEVARRQEAKSLELRSSVELGKLLQQRDNRQEARDLVAPIYNWFTEGFDSPDLKEAKALLEELS